MLSYLGSMSNVLGKYSVLFIVLTLVMILNVLLLVAILFLSDTFVSCG